VTGFVFALCFALGIGLLIVGLFTDASAFDGERWRAAWFEAAGSVRSVRRFAFAGALAVVSGTIVWSVVSVPVLAIAGGAAGAYAPLAWVRRTRERARNERERAWPAALAQLADALEAGIAFPAAISLLAETGPEPLRPQFASFRATVRTAGLETALDGLARARERTADTVALLLRAGLLELPAGGLAPVVRELSQVLSERFEAREKARSRAASLEIEAALLALSPIVLLLLVGSASPGYLNAYRTAGGTVVAAVAGLVIFGCYLLMRRLGRIPEPRRTGAGR
jgi:tight adherence protein B